MIEEGGLGWCLLWKDKFLMQYKQGNSKSGLISIDFHGTNAGNANISSISTNSNFANSFLFLTNCVPHECWVSVCISSICSMKISRLQSRFVLPRLYCIKNMFSHKMYQSACFFNDLIKSKVWSFRMRDSLDLC